MRGESTTKTYFLSIGALVINLGILFVKLFGEVEHYQRLEKSYYRVRKALIITSFKDC